MYFAKEEFLNQTRIVFLDKQKVPFEFFVIHKSDVNFGDVYQARIVEKMPDLKSYFADIGLERSVFVKNKKELQKGQVLTIQIHQEAKLDKVPCARLCKEQLDLPVGLAKKADLPDTSDKTEIPWNEEIEEAFEDIQVPIINFADGAQIIFERTHAFWSVDIDSGKSTLITRELNRLAAPIIAREIIRRNLSGNILIDFIGHKKRKDLKEFIPVFKECLSLSDVSFSVAGVSPLGNFEIRRNRHKACIPEILKSDTYRAYGLFRDVLKSKTPIKQISICPVLYKTLNTRLAEDWALLQKKNGQEIKLIVNPELKEYQI